MEKKINMRLRFKNPVFVLQLVVAIALPIMGYFGIAMEDITTFSKLGQVLFNAISNPYVLFLIVTSVVNTINDPTTRGFSDSTRVQNYKELGD